MDELVPVWFDTVITKGIGGLVLLHLEGHPPAETINATVSAWVAVMWNAPISWDKEQDTIRLAKAFQTVGATCSRWPAPSDVLKSMPPRKQQKALPESKPSKEDLAKGRQAIKAILENLNPSSDTDTDDGLHSIHEPLYRSLFKIGCLSDEL